MCPTPELGLTQPNKEIIVGPKNVIQQRGFGDKIDIMKIIDISQYKHHK